jgi:hypothetical protein
VLTYGLVLLVVVAVLYGSFRALGGGEPVAAEDYRTVLARLCEFTAARATELGAALVDAAERPAAGGRPAADALVEVAGGARKKLGGYHQQLARIESDASGAERVELEAARTLLTAAIEDLAWACRLVEGGTYRDNPGIQGAVARLREHAGECLDEASRLAAPGPAA